VTPGRSKRLWVLVVVAAAVAAPLGWFGSDHLERDDDFCNACHLEPGVPLHIDIRRDYDQRPAGNLAALHAAAPHSRGPSAFRCIDCHGGVGLLGKARTKVLAAKDAFWWAVGRFDEPTEMGWPLWDEDCRQCHEDFRDAAARAADPNPPFHALSVHNVALGTSCVECHQVHATGGNEDLYYLQPTQVRRLCAKCHTEFQ
jgi:predicted CXXCH cytochrome family protein